MNFASWLSMVGSTLFHPQICVPMGSSLPCGGSATAPPPPVPVRHLVRLSHFLPPVTKAHAAVTTSIGRRSSFLFPYLLFFTFSSSSSAATSLLALEYFTDQEKGFAVLRPSSWMQVFLLPFCPCVPTPKRFLPSTSCGGLELVIGGEGRGDGSIRGGEGEKQHRGGGESGQAFISEGIWDAGVRGWQAHSGWEKKGSFLFYNKRPLLFHFCYASAKLESSKFLEKNCCWAMLEIKSDSCIEIRSQLMLLNQQPQ